MTSIFSIIILIVCATIHEVAHGYTAKKLGDPTAALAGRITLNPLRHIDPFMTVILPGILILSGSPIIFGGAKPVPVDPRYFKNPLKGMAIVAAAGPLSNAILGGIGIIVLKSLSFLEISEYLSYSVVTSIYTFLFSWVLINAVLGVFNLFPLPPLDGGRIVMGFLPRKLAIPYAKLERYGLLIIFGLLYLGIIDTFLRPILEGIITFLEANIVVK